MAANLMTLPEEIIEYILEDESITFSDIAKFAQTCKWINRIVKNSGKLWKTKFIQRWPRLKEVYEENMKSEGHPLFWLGEIQASIKSRHKLMQQLTLLSKKTHWKQEPSDSDLKDFDPLFRPEYGAHRLAYHFLVDELIALIEHPVWTANLTQKHYAYRVIRYLKQSYLVPEWHEFISLPHERQILERGATLVAQWGQPEKHISYKHISSLFDDIAEQTKEVLKCWNPAHSIFSTPSEKIEAWKCMNISDNQWVPTETRQIMDALCNILFGKLGFHGNNIMYYSAENSFINEVLEHKRGISITLAIIFESIARRLGVRCEAVCFPSHFLLRWKEKYEGPECEELESYYIDVFNGGRFLTKNNCPRVAGELKCPIQKYNVHSNASAVEVVERMATNLEVATRQHTRLNDRLRWRYALELKHMIRPHDTETILPLGRFYIDNQLDIAELVTILEDMQMDVHAKFSASLILEVFYAVQDCLKPEKNERKKRRPELKYAVGLIMWHTVEEYLCVIAGWDFPHAQLSKMNLDGVVVDAEPLYYVLVDDGSSRQVVQENLLPAPNPGWVNHCEIGRYFCQFAETHYIPNEETAREYPEDAECRNNLLSMFKFC